MAWIIDVDHIAEPNAKPGTNANAVGVTGPSYAPSDLKDEDYVFHFRLYDDDGELYYSGRSTKPYSLSPLDFGKSNAGCTEIRYLVAGTERWLAV